jgi:hypothetical protein
MSFMLLSHVLASLCLYISSKAMHSYIPNPCGNPSVFLQASFEWCHLVISFSKWLISMWCQQGREDHKPPRYAMIKRLQVISTSGNVTRTHLSYLLSSKATSLHALSFLVLQVCSCALVFHTIFLCTHLG